MFIFGFPVSASLLVCWNQYMIDIYYLAGRVPLLFGLWIRKIVLSFSCMKPGNNKRVVSSNCDSDCTKSPVCGTFLHLLVIL